MVIRYGLYRRDLNRLPLNLWNCRYITKAIYGRSNYEKVNVGAADY
jgi:hypothetical protein